MRALLLGVLLAISVPVWVNTAVAFDTTTQVPSPIQPNESTLKEHNHYRNVDGREVHSPAHTLSGAAPSGASAKCGDGSFSFSLHHRGTCSHHGGVTEWLN